MERTPSQIAGSPVNNAPYIAGTMNTEGTWSQRYGYWESRLRHDKHVAGMGVAWWLWNTGGTNAEIDMLESFGLPNNQDFSSQTVHDGAAWYKYGGVDLTQYHTWGAEWQPGFVTLYLDRQPMGTSNSVANFTSPMVMMVGGGDSASYQPVDVGSLPLTGFYDYIGVWAHKPF